MCGIAGYFSNDNKFCLAELKAMADSIAHRGPDASGIFEHNGIALTHRRLSIIDLSSAANQPMLSQSGNLLTIFNGEIYNYQEIAKELGYNAKTNSDTEIILAAFEKWGPLFVNKLNGMFAIAIFNKKENKLFLFRDRLGIKPLFIFQQKNNLAFSSELKALTKLSLFKKNNDIDSKAVAKFLHLGYIPAPLSIYKNIKKFPQGHYAVFDGKLLKYTKYWSVNNKLTDNIISDETEAKQQLKCLIQKSIKYRLKADVPYGTFLSGGIDSSLISAVAQSSSNQQLKTFSIGFAEAKFNESIYAQEIAKYLQTDHHEFILTQTDALNKISDIFTYYDEPFADSSAIPTMLVSQMARSKVTMTLSGDGGDELFHGYGMYNWAQRLSSLPYRIARPFAQPILKNLGSKYKRASHLLDKVSADNIKSHIFSQEQYLFSEKEITDLLIDKSASTHCIINNHANMRNFSAAEQQALFDINYYLPDDLLVKVDRASMCHSLETRVPLLDHNIVEFAINLDEKLKRKGADAKYLLKQVLYDYVPAKYFNRPKWGFGIPLENWLKKDLKYLADDYLNSEIVKKAGFVNIAFVEKLKYNFYNKNHSYLYNRIWVLICLHKWYIDIYQQSNK